MQMKERMEKQMQKTNKKLNANPVGANCVRPHFEEMTLKNQKGITLIALIITIIVMLILVGVTINVALNGGLFEKAEDAANQTQLASEKEQLMMAALGAYDVETGVDFTKMELPEIFEGTNGTYTSKETGKTYSVNQETVEIIEGTQQKIQCFGGKYTESDGTETEFVYAVYYEDKVMKICSGKAGEKLAAMQPDLIISNIIINYDKEFYVLENGERVDIGTGATKLVFEEDPNVNFFIINGKLYMSAEEEKTIDAVLEEYSDFDIITRLPE